MPMRILEVSSEVAPFARTGGLGDVLGALPRALAKLENEVIVAMPRYESIDFDKHRLVRQNWTMPITVGDKTYPLEVDIIRNHRTKIHYWMIHNEKLFGRSELYRDIKTGKDYVDNDDRFIFFNRAVLEIAKKLGWRPDVIHCHDWQAALIPAYVKTGFGDDRFFENVKTVLTIHNLAFQGTFPADTFPKLGLPEDLFYAMTGPFEFFGNVNFLKSAVMLADKVTTVSEQYAKEIQTSVEFGAGLDGVLTQRSHDLSGIVNGVDYLVWSPSRDNHLPYRYSMANLGGKRKSKIELLGKAGLPIRENTPLVGVISRLADQKGFDLIAEAADEMFSMNLQMILLGTGEKEYHRLFTALQKKYPDKLKVYLAFDDSLAHFIEGGSDIFLMPSRYEPCGLNQLYSLKYGTVPVVRKVGGLADTVEDYNPETTEGTGFVFEEYTSEAMLEALSRAVTLFAQKRPWKKLAKAGMQQDFSWDVSAGKYLRLFETLM